jgi:glycosyltransferase involved in cell wall biosynthesis
MDLPAGLFAAPVADLLPVRDARGPVRVLIASLAPGGAERIVVEWLGAEAARGRDVELAVLHARRTALPAPAGVRLRVRGRESPGEFLAALAREWSGPQSVSTHLVADADLAILWAGGVRTVPVVHNARAGWRNDPASWPREAVPLAVACARSVAAEMVEAGCAVPVVAIRHRPRVGPAATDPRARAAVRASLGIGEETMLVLAIGAFKAQKDHARAVEVLAALAKRRDAVLAILGGLLDRVARGELDRVLEAAVRLGVADRLRLPGFVSPIEPWLAAADALVNVSRFEGLSIAVQEALAASVPVVATDVGGQREIDHPALALLPSTAGTGAFASRLAALPVRRMLAASPAARAPRAWSLTLAHRAPCGPPVDTLFVTANLNAGGAQRSLVNLAGALAGRHAFAIAVCGESTHPAFARVLASRGVDVFRACAERDDFAIAESLLAHAAARGVRALAFWNAAPGVKLLVARFAPPSLRLVDVSPGRYAFRRDGVSRAPRRTGAQACGPVAAGLPPDRDHRERRRAARGGFPARCAPLPGARPSRAQQAARDDPGGLRVGPPPVRRGAAARHRQCGAPPRGLRRRTPADEARRRVVPRARFRGRIPRGTVDRRHRPRHPPGLPQCRAGGAVGGHRRRGQRERRHGRARRRR